MEAYHSITTNQQNKLLIMKSTIKSLVLLSFGLCFISTVNAQFWGSKTIKGNGKLVTESRITSDYDAIKCAGFMDFILVSGSEGKITIEGEENLLKYIITEVNNNNLIVKVEKGVYLKSSWNKTIKITIPFEDINNISLSGSGDVYNKDIIKESDLKVSISGSGDMDLKLETNNLYSTITGSGDMTITGNTENLITKITGSGDFNGFDLNANNTEAYVTGSGDIEVVANKFLKGRVTGSGDIEYKGNPETEDTKVPGSGRISN